MAYEEYDYYNEPTTGSLKESLYQILHGLQDRTKLREAGTSFKEALQLTPNVTESLGRGGVAQAIGTSGDLRDLSNTINSYLPKGVRNFTRAAEFLANPYATAIQQTAPTTEETLDFVPRVSAPYEGYKQHETLGEYVAPALGYFGGKAAKAYGNYVGPTAYKAVEDYLTKTGGILNAVEPGEAKKIQEVASAIDELGFHSPLENAILKIQQPKGTGDQFLKQLEKTPGVKTEELDVTGVKQYLLDHPTVTKQELLDQMATSRLKLENKILNAETGQGNTYDEYRLEGGDVYHDDDYINSLADDLHYDMKNDPVIRDQEKQALLEADPERYADYETNPYSQARLEEDIDGVLYENAKQQAHDMYYENPIHHYYDEHGYDIYGNDEMGYSFKDPSGNFIKDIGSRNGTYDLSDAEAALRDYHLEQGVLQLDEEGAAKFEDYTLPGNYTNYRELLTTLPSREKGAYFYASNPKKMTGQVEEQLSEYGFKPEYKVNWEDGTFSGGYDKESAEAVAKAGKAEAGQGTIIKKFPNYQEAFDYAQSRPQEERLANHIRPVRTDPDFTSSHFDEPNILAHTRLNDRIINGKKTLMVEEIQSDWHQAGRRKGYATNFNKPEYTIETDPNGIFRIKDINNERFEPIVDGERMSGFTTQEAAEFAARANLNRMPKKRGMEVPDAPFKKNWHELMMKQILNEAVKGDYDAIAFTTGKQQAERYSLSKQINELTYNPETKRLWAYKKDEHYPVISKEVQPDDLPDLIGKEAAKKLLETKLIPYSSVHGELMVHELKGQELDVGGEGMKGFYDKILPDFVNKYTKKYGMAVKKENLGLSDWRQDLSDEELAKGLEHFGLDTKKFYQMGITARSELYEKISKELYPIKSKDDVHFVELTDAAKKDIKSKGQPLFSGIGLAAPPLLMDNEEDN